MRISHSSRPNEKPQHFLQFTSHQLLGSNAAVDHIMIYKMTVTEEAHVSWDWHYKWHPCVARKRGNAHLLSVDGREESECMPVWSEEGTPMPPAIWFI